MSDKDLEEVTDDMLSETDSDEFSEVEDLSDFVDLEDLEGLMAEEDFVDLEGLGDLTDLGDLSDMSDLSDGEEIPDLDALSDGRAETDDTVSDMTDFEDLSSLEASMDAALLAEENTKAGTESSAAMPEPALEELGLGTDGTESALEEPEFRTVEPEPVMAESDMQASEPEADVSLDAMVDGFLDNLDATGSPATSEMPEEEGDLDQLLEMLGEPEALAAVEEEPEAPKKKAPKPEEDVFGLDEMMALDEEQSGEEGFSPDEDMAGLLDDLAEPDSVSEAASQPDEKEPGLLKKLFGNIVTDEIAEAELAQRAADKEAALAKEEEAAKAKEEKEAAKAAKAEEKAAAKQAKAEEKALKKAAKAEEKAAKKAEKEARKAEEAAQAELEVTGKLNKVGVSIIVILTAMFLTVEITGTNLFSYKSTLKNAENYFDMKKYTQAYQEILGTDLKKKDRETYDKIVTVMKVQRPINSYENYVNMKYYPDALNALLVGLKKYDENIETARNLEVDQDMDACRAEIISILQSEFGVSETEAYDILSMEKEAYTNRVVEIGMEQQ